MSATNARSGDTGRKPAGKSGERPVFIFAGGRRTGSTLFQRLLISSGEIFVWGEHNGVLVPNLEALLVGMDKWFNSGAGARAQLVTFREKGYNAWIPNMCPPMEYFEHGCRAFLRQSLGIPAQKLSFPRWGFKEVRYGAASAVFLQKLFPDASFVFVVRNPRDCLLSIHAAEWGERESLKEGPEPFLRVWTRLSRELHDTTALLKRAVLVRYEDLVESPVENLARIAKTVGVEAGRFKLQEVLQNVERGPSRERIELGPADSAALAHPDVVEVAGKLGYSLQ